MTQSEAILNNEAKRLVEALPQIEVGSEKYMATLSTLERLLGLKQFAAEAIEDEGAPTLKIISMKPVAAKDPENWPPEEPAVENWPPEEDAVFAEPAKTWKKEEVRAALGAYRQKTGESIPNLLKQFGADSFSALPESQYAAVMEKIGG